MASKFDQQIKENISHRRKSLRITQAEMAEKLGVDRNTYRYIETGKTILVSERVDQIADILGVEPEELILGFELYNPESDPRLYEFKVDYGRKMADSERALLDEIASLHGQVVALEEKINILQDSLRDKTEIINFLKAKN